MVILSPWEQALAAAFRVCLPPSGDKTGVPTGDKYSLLWSEDWLLGWVQQVISWGEGYNGLILGEVWVPSCIQANRNVGPSSD